MVTVKGNVAEFSFYRPNAQHVFLVGDFNSWRDGQNRMTRMADGHWVAQLRLPPGDFNFRYRADGAWFTDYAAFGVEANEYGLNSVVRIAAQAARPAAAKIRPSRETVFRPDRTAGKAAIAQRSQKIAV